MADNDSGSVPSDPEKLRRFALTAGLILITYLAAGIALQPSAQVSVFGVPFLIKRPTLLPIGLALASLCAGARFYYYAVLLGTSPYRKRRDLLDNLLVYSNTYDSSSPYEPSRDSRQKAAEISMYWGERKFETTKFRCTRAEMDARAAMFCLAFPKWAGARTSAKVVSDQIEDGVYSIEVFIPLRCRIASIFEDIDYTAPVWLNAFALALFLWSLIGHRITAALASIRL